MIRSDPRLKMRRSFLASCRYPRRSTVCSCVRSSGAAYLRCEVHDRARAVAAGVRLFQTLLYLQLRRLIPFAFAHALMDGASVFIGVLLPN